MAKWWKDCIFKVRNVRFLLRSYRERSSERLGIQRTAPFFDSRFYLDRKPLRSKSTAKLRYSSVKLSSRGRPPNSASTKGRDDAKNSHMPNKQRLRNRGSTARNSG